MPHRVAYVIGELDKGGAEYQLTELIRHLDRTRFTPAVFVLAAEGYWIAPLRKLGVSVHTFPRRRSLDLARVRHLRAALRAYQPALLHTVLWAGNVYGRVAALGLHIPVVLAAERNVIPRPAWQQQVERWLDRATSHYLVNSAAIRAELVHNGRLPDSKITVIHNGIDLACLPPFDLARAGARAALGFAPERRLVAQVGRLTHQKDYPTFLAAAAEVVRARSDVDILIVGEGEERAMLVARAEQLGIGTRVRFLGLRHDVPAVLAAVDVLALTSLYEGLPNVVIEAMAVGAVPVITDVGGARELMTSDVEGVIVPPRAPEQVAAAILALLADDRRRLDLARAARKRVEDRLTIGAMANQTCALYAQLLGAA